MFKIEIRIEVDDLQLPAEITTLEQAEATIEDRVGNALEPLFSSMTIQEVKLSPGQVERDWDVLLRE